MSFQIYYTPRSKETLLSVYEFILIKFGKNSADKFISKAEKTISTIAEFPLMFRSSIIDENIRIGLITKQTSLFYLVKETSIDLLFFWDNRQEPISI